MPNFRLRPVVSRVVVYTHRWLGIVLGALFSAGSYRRGVMYAGMPRLAPTERLAQGRCWISRARRWLPLLRGHARRSGKSSAQHSEQSARVRIREHGRSDVLRR